LAIGFDTFHNHFKIERFGHSQNLGQDGHRDRLGADHSGKGLVDLDGVGKKIQQLVEFE